MSKSRREDPEDSRQGDGGYCRTMTEGSDKVAEAAAWMMAHQASGRLDTPGDQQRELAAPSASRRHAVAAHDSLDQAGTLRVCSV
jgi:hypothetical protein